jgi:hypothetical protein
VGVLVDIGASHLVGVSYRVQDRPKSRPKSRPKPALPSAEYRYIEPGSTGHPLP